MTTVSTAMTWVNNSLGKSYDFDGAYGAQCFDYINQYAYDLFKTSFSGAGAIDLLSTGNKNGFKVIKDGANLYPQSGDIFIYQINGSQWGHTGIVIQADKAGMTIADQNFNNVQRVQKHYMKYTESYGVIKGWIRPPFSGSGTTTPPPTSTKLKIYKADDLQKINGIWQIRCNQLVPTGFTWVDNGIACADVDVVNSDGSKASSQVVSKGCLFTLITNNVQSVGTPIKGTGGYNWSKVVLKNSGAIWLSVANKNNLLYGTK